MASNKTNFILKRDWLKYAANAKESADSWRKGANGWPMNECEREADAYMVSYDQSLERAKNAPVKIVMYYEDGRVETIE